jgi:hypothetical protein
MDPALPLRIAAAAAAVALRRWFAETPSPVAAAALFAAVAPAAIAASTDSISNIQSSIISLSAPPDLVPPVASAPLLEALPNLDKEEGRELLECIRDNTGALPARRTVRFAPMLPIPTPTFPKPSGANPVAAAVVGWL